MKYYIFSKGELVMTKKERDRARFERYIRRTLGNKICAIAMIAIGGLVTKLSGDATALVFLSMLAVPMFFAWEQWIY